MMYLQDVKHVDVIAPQSVVTTPVTGVFDTLGYDQVDIIVSLAPDSNIPTTLTIAEGDTTSAYTNITACVGGGVGGWTLLTAGDTAASQFIHFQGRMGGRKRYLQVTLTNDGARLCSVLGIGSRAVIQPNTSTLRNATLVTF